MVARGTLKRTLHEMSVFMSLLYALSCFLMRLAGRKRKIYQMVLMSLREMCPGNGLPAFLGELR